MKRCAAGCAASGASPKILNLGTLLSPLCAQPKPILCYLKKTCLGHTQRVFGKQPTRRLWLLVHLPNINSLMLLVCTPIFSRTVALCRACRQHIRATENPTKHLRSSCNSTGQFQNLHSIEISLETGLKSSDGFRRTQQGRLDYEGSNSGNKTA